jgi:hypothetical protein
MMAVGVVVWFNLKFMRDEGRMHLYYAVLILSLLVGCFGAEKVTINERQPKASGLIGLLFYRDSNKCELAFLDPSNLRVASILTLPNYYPPSIVSAMDTENGVFYTFLHDHTPNRADESYLVGINVNTAQITTEVRMPNEIHQQYGVEYDPKRFHPYLWK